MRHRRGAPGVGLALAGGGPLGGIYEIGALLALADSLEGVQLNALDVYVGVSSGSFLAAALANGISPAQMYRLFIADSDEPRLTPELFLRPALREFGHRMFMLPALLTRIARRYLRNPLRHNMMESLAMLARVMPTGVFDNRAIDAFLADLFAAPSRTNDFRQLGRKLFLVATNLDSGAPVTFGAAGFDDVPISRAIQASAALPGLFPPVEIHGQHYVDGALNKTLHASVALDQGIGLLLCINPLVPFDASEASRHSGIESAKLKHGGLPIVLSQTFRAIIHSRMRVGMEKYDTQYPNADVVLFEPAREDSDMFFANIFSYAQRAKLCAGAFQKTRAQLLARSSILGPQLVRHGVALRMERLHDTRRTVRDAIADPRPLRVSPQSAGNVRQTTRDLRHALDELERWLARAA